MNPPALGLNIFLRLLCILCHTMVDPPQYITPQGSGRPQGGSFKGGVNAAMGGHWAGNQAGREAVRHFCRPGMGRLEVNRQMESNRKQARSTGSEPFLFLLSLWAIIKIDFNMWETTSQLPILKRVLSL